MEEFADDNFKIDENEKKLSKIVESTVGKGEIARYEQFFLFSQFFQRLVLQTRKTRGLFEKGLNGHLTIVRLQILNCLKLKEFADNNFRCGKSGGKFIDTIKKI